MRNPRRLGLAAFPALAVTMMLFNSLALHAQTPTAPKPASRYWARQCRSHVLPAPRPWRS